MGPEARHALRHRRGHELAAPDIWPVIIEGPPVERAWRMLRHLHFNDKLVYVKAGDRR